ncbi:MAG: hypothetical protein KF835_07780 [Xanthobacteraceae bacterium]|nr:hypothetical protein [Xanthobacteraceae bacterium]
MAASLSGFFFGTFIFRSTKAVTAPLPARKTRPGLHCQISKKGSVGLSGVSFAANIAAGGSSRTAPWREWRYFQIEQARKTFSLPPRSARGEPARLIFHFPPAFPPKNAITVFVTPVLLPEFRSYATACALLRQKRPRLKKLSASRQNPEADVRRETRKTI